MANGNPNCRLCNGIGVVRAVGGYRKCQCVAGTREQRDWNAYLNSIGAKHPAPKPPRKD